jgi:hypothetical protein
MHGKTRTTDSVFFFHEDQEKRFPPHTHTLSRTTQTPTLHETIPRVTAVVRRVYDCGVPGNVGWLVDVGFWATRR